MKKDPKEIVLDASTKPLGEKPKIKGRMPKFAKRVEKTLFRNEAMPRRTNDCSMIGDLAHLEWRIYLLKKALLDFIASPSSKKSKVPFEERLMVLTSEIDGMRRVCQTLNGPIKRLLKKKCGDEGLISAKLRGASTILQGFS